MSGKKGQRLKLFGSKSLGKKIVRLDILKACFRTQYHFKCTFIPKLMFSIRFNFIHDFCYYGIPISQHRKKRSANSTRLL